MKIFATSILSLFFIPGLLISQQLLSPADYIQLMEQSDIGYVLEILPEPLPLPDRSGHLTQRDVYRSEENGQLVTRAYQVSDQVIELLKKAEDAFAQDQHQEARKYYQKIIDADSSFYMVWTFLGQTYEIDRDYEKAIEIYQNTVKKNYIDFMAHWFLADAYIRTGEKEKALRSICLAQILNRNNPRIQQSLVNIFEANKLRTRDWTFHPQVIIDSISPEEIKIKFDEEWLGYGMIQAAWEYEKEFIAERQIPPGHELIIREKEALMGWISGKDKKQIKKDPALNALSMAIDADLVDQYITYEILLPDYPDVAYQFSEEILDTLVDYLIEVRGKLK
jgi:tetratricopeptide (TPR) repeat protein